MNDDTLTGRREKVIASLDFQDFRVQRLKYVGVFLLTVGPGRLHREQGNPQREAARRNIVPTGQSDVEERERGELRARLASPRPLLVSFPAFQDAPEVPPQVCF